MASNISAYEHSSPEHNAPEVVERSSDLIAAPNQVHYDTQYPQVAQQYPETKTYPSQDASNYTSGTGYSSQSGNNYGQEKNSPLLGDAGLEVATEQASPSRRRKRWIWIIAGVSLVLLAVGLGAGLGVGLSSPDSSKSESQSTPTPTSTSTKSISSTTTSASPTAVTSGTTGVASFSCGSQQQTASTNGTTFTQECYTQYTTNRGSYYYSTDNVTTANLGGKYTTYNITACLDACDSYNTEGGGPPCRAVTYYANLSAPIDMWGANCFLKNDRGTDAHTDAVDWSHTMSAFMSCLNVTCWGENA